MIYTDKFSDCRIQSSIKANASLFKKSKQITCKLHLECKKAKALRYLYCVAISTKFFQSIKINYTLQVVFLLFYGKKKRKSKLTKIISFLLETIHTCFGGCPKLRSLDLTELLYLPSTEGWNKRFLKWNPEP